MSTIFNNNIFNIIPFFKFNGQIIKELEQITAQTMTNMSSELGDKFSKKSFDSVPFSKYIEKKSRFIKNEKKTKF